jgi:two-component system NarL family sensor kinase
VILKSNNLNYLLNKQDARFVFIDYLPEAYLVLDRSLNIIWANKKFISITHSSFSLIVGAQIHTILPDYDALLTHTENHIFTTTPATIEGNEYFLIKVKNLKNELKKSRNDDLLVPSKKTASNETLKTQEYTSEDFQKICTIITEVCFRLDADYNIVYVNNAACLTWDKEEQEVIGENIFSILNDIYVPIKSVLELALFSKNKVSKEIHLSKIDRWIFINVHPESSGLIVLHSDITEKVKYRKNLQQTETQLKTLIEHVPDLVTRWNSDIKLLFANTSFAKTKINSFIDAQIKANTQEKIKSFDWTDKIKKAFLTGKTFNHNTTLTTNEGVAYLESSIIPEKNEEGIIESVLAISRDVTESKLSAQKILDAKNFLQSVFDASVNGILVLKAVRNVNQQIIDFKCILSNNSSIKILGYNPENLNLTKVVNDKTKSIYFDKLKNLTEDAQRIEEEIYYDYSKNRLWLHIVIEKLDDGLLLTFSDITKRKEAEKETIKTLKLMQNLIDGSPIVLVHYKADRDIHNNVYDFTVLNSNDNAAELLGINTKELNGKQLSQIMPNVFSHEFGKHLKDFANTDSPARFETYYNADGLDNYWDISLVKKSDGIILTALNITEKIKSETKIRELQKQQQANLLNAVMQTQEEERRRIAESLHNDFGQILNIAVISLSKDNKDVTDLLNQAIKKMRSISYELIPPLLKDFGLEIALRDMFDIKLLSSGIKVIYEIKGLHERINNDLEIAIYRIIQEVLNNTIKHASAEKIEILIKNNKKQLIITTEDNGKGFDTANNREGFGLRYITSRVKLLNGLFYLQSKINEGTKCTITIPLKNDHL